MTISVKTSSGKTISIKCDKKQKTAIISDEVERRSLIPRDMTYFVHKGKVISEKNTTEENDIEAEATLEMSLRLMGGMEMNEQMDTHQAEEDREKEEVGGRERRKDDETKRRHDVLEKRYNGSTQKVRRKN